MREGADGESMMEELPIPITACQEFMSDRLIPAGKNKCKPPLIQQTTEDSLDLQSSETLITVFSLVDPETEEKLVH